MMTDAGGNVVWSGEFLPFGQEWDARAMVNHYKFTGQERDAETGMDYFEARHYTSQFGRFLQPDPAGMAAVDPSNPQSWNQYAYVGGNPLNFTDPSGMCNETAYTDPSGVIHVGAKCPPPPSEDPNQDIWDLMLDDPCGTGLLLCTFGPPLVPIPPKPVPPILKQPPQPGPQPKPQTPTSKQPLLVCAAQTANKLSLAQAFGTNGKKGFFNNVANGVLGNTFSTIAEYAYGGSNVEFGTTAYDLGTKATESSINAVTRATPIADLGLGAESAGQIAEGVATEGLGGVLTLGKLIYDGGTFAYGFIHCH